MAARRRPAGRRFPARSFWCCRAAARSARTKSACTRRCTRPGIEPDWVIGTSIGAINAALDRRQCTGESDASPQGILGPARAEIRTGHLQRVHRAFQRVGEPRDRVQRGFRPFSRRTRSAWLSSHTPLGVDKAAYYTAAPLKDTLADLDRSRPSRRSQSSLDGRRRQRPNGRDSLLRQSRRNRLHRPRTRLRRAATGVPCRVHRRRPVLGWRHLFEHADRGRARRQAAQGFRHFRGAHVESGGARVPRRSGR